MSRMWHRSSPTIIALVFLALSARAIVGVERVILVNPIANIVEEVSAVVQMPMLVLVRHLVGVARKTATKMEG